MIVDTSALIAILTMEPGWKRLADAVAAEESLLPSPALVEVRRVASRRTPTMDGPAALLLHDFLSRRMRVLAFTGEHADAAAVANLRYGTGLGHGGTLNLLDLMVYACAKVERRPILCTGSDFAATDASIHPASRRG